MGVKQVQIDVNELTLGMFVSKLDRPWSQTSFPLQGFYIREMDEIKELKAICRHVYIDVAKGAKPVANNLKTLSTTGSNAKVAQRMTKSQPVKVPVAPLKIRRDAYPSAPEPLKKEVAKARELHQKVFGAVTEVMSSLENPGPSIQGTKRVASEMVDSILRNPDAMTWLTQVREKDEFTYSHSVRSAVLAILFGRHLGLARKELDYLAVGVLLKDVGKLKLDPSLLALAERTAAQEAEYEKFVEYGVELLRTAGDVPAKAIGVVKTHCERLNGSGFPQHLQGDKIPLLGKIAGIVTFYDEVTNPRGASQPIAPSKAVSKLYDLRNIEFQEELCVEFIRAIGLYPTGTIVELNTGEIGVVIEQNFGRRLKPKIAVVLDACKHHISEPVIIDLAEDDKRKQALIDAGKKTLEEAEKIEIVQDIEPGIYDIDIAAIRDEHVLKQAKRGLFDFFKRG